jgi:hypothetical protein
MCKGWRSVGYRGWRSADYGRCLFDGGGSIDRKGRWPALRLQAQCYENCLYWLLSRGCFRFPPNLHTYVQTSRYLPPVSSPCPAHQSGPVSQPVSSPAPKNSLAARKGNYTPGRGGEGVRVLLPLPVRSASRVVHLDPGSGMGPPQCRFHFM